MKNKQTNLLIVALILTGFAISCSMFGGSNANGNVNSTANSNSGPNVSPTPAPTSTLPKYTATRLAEFLRAEYQKPGGKENPNAGLKDKEIEVSGNVSLVNGSEIDFFVDQATLVRCQGSFYSDKDFPVLESYYRDNVQGNTKLMPNATAKGLFSSWGGSKKGGTEIVLTGCQLLSASRL